jgi:hypothetical protein
MFSYIPMYNLTSGKSVHEALKFDSQNWQRHVPSNRNSFEHRIGMTW